LETLSPLHGAATTKRRRSSRTTHSARRDAPRSALQPRIDPRAAEGHGGDAEKEVSGHPKGPDHLAGVLWVTSADQLGPGAVAIGVVESDDAGVVSADPIGDRAKSA
jgi:hypothetical protein